MITSSTMRRWMSSRISIATSSLSRPTRMQKQPTIICKRFYAEQCLKILENSDDFEEAQDKPTVIAETLTTFAESQGLRMTAETDKNGMEKEPQLPSLHLTAKLHKDPVAFRHIQGSRFTPLTLVAKTVQRALRLVLVSLSQIWSEQFLVHTGRVPGRAWAIGMSDFTVHLRKLRGVVKQQGSPLADVTGFESHDFTNLYSRIPQQDLLLRLEEVIHLAFKVEAAKCSMGRRSTAPVDAIFVPKETSYETKWVCSNDRNTDGTTLKAASLIAMIQYVVLNIFVCFGERVFKQLHGFPMGINCGVEMADIYLLSYELAFAIRQLKKFRASLETRSRRSTAQPVINEAAFSHTLPPVLLWLMTTVRYIDDVFMPILRDYDVARHIYDRRSEDGDDGVYPMALVGANGVIDMPLQLNLASSGDEVHFLDVTVMFEPSTGALDFKLYDKRRGNPLFETTLNFPPMDSMLADECKYTVLRSQMHRYDRNCTFAADFIANTAALAVQMMRNRYDERRVLDEIHKYRSWDLSKGNWQKVKGRVLDRVAQALHPHTHTTQHRARVQTGPTR